MPTGIKWYTDALVSLQTTEQNSLICGFDADNVSRRIYCDKRRQFITFTINPWIED